MITYARIPDELIRFFEVGRNLLIKGNAGTGKTTLSLDLLHHFSSVDCVYFTTRAPVSVLYDHHPWLKDKVVLGPEEAQFLDKRQDSPGQLLGRLRDQLLKMNHPILVIDTWDAMAEEMEDKEQLRIAKAIFTMSYVTEGLTIVIEENDQMSFLDFLADGVVVLTLGDVFGEAEEGRVYEDRLEKRTTREMEIRKLRGVRISNKKYMFTLDDEKFHSFPPFYENLAIIPKKIDDINDNCISYGISDLDNITGGLKKGSFNLFEIEHGVDKRYMQICTQIIWNAVKNSRGTIIVPSIGERFPDGLLKEILTYSPRGKDFTDDINAIIELAKNQFDSRHQKNGLLIFLGVDTIVSLYGDSVVFRMAEAFNKISQEIGSIIIVTMKRGIKQLAYITHLADTHIVFKDVTNALVLYGMRPKSGLYAIEVVNDRVRLIPVV